jgi:hypothetical protein
LTHTGVRSIVLNNVGGKLINNTQKINQFLNGLDRKQDLGCREAKHKDPVKNAALMSIEYAR